MPATETLYELTDNLFEIQNLIENSGDESLAELLADTEEALQISLDEKLEGMMKIRANKAARISGIKAEIERLAKLAEAESKDIGRLEEYMEFQLSKLGYNYADKNKKAKDVGLFKIQFKKLPAKVIVVDSKKLPPHLFNIPKAPEPKPDLKAIMEEIKEKITNDGLDPKKVDEKVFEDLGVRYVNNNQKIEFK